MGDDEDFLWKCAMHDSYPPKETTTWLTPSFEDEPRHYLRAESKWNNSSRIYRERFSHQKGHINLSSSLSCNEGIQIQVDEMREDGILGIIGGEVWEASLLLCAYCTLYSYDIIGKRTMEVGSGVGLPAFYLAELNRLFTSYESPGHVSLTDFDDRVLANLSSIARKFYHEIMLDDLSDDDGSKIDISIQKIDWNDFRQCRCEEIQSRYNNMEFDIMMGSALCYSPHHTCLADTIKYFMSGECKQVVIIQIKDRPGFDMLLRRLEALSLDYTIEDCPENIYNCAQRIKYKSSSNNPQGSNSAHQSICKEFYFDREFIRHFFAQSEASNHNPSGLLGSENGCELVTDDSSTNCGFLPPTSSYISNLIKTDRESFALLTVFKSKAI